MDWLKTSDLKDEDPSNDAPPWNILIVDDDEQIHLITRQALKNFSFENRRLDFISAYSGREAREILSRGDKKYALILLDVVMEEDDAGLKLAQYIREELKNHFTRIVLRTGQPGMAPEYSVVKEYEIDAYRSKIELKKADLEAVFFTSLRSYRDISALQTQRQCVEQVVSSITKINSATDLPDFASAILTQISQFIGGQMGELLLDSTEAYAVSRSHEKTRILAFSGNSRKKDRVQSIPNLNSIRDEVRNAIELGFQSHRDVYEPPYFVHYMMTQRRNEIVLTLKTGQDLSESDKKLLKLFSSNVTLTYENLILNEEIFETQNLLIRLLGGAMESRSRETGSHVKRVGEFSALMAQLIGMPGDYVERIRIASPLHDVGKVSTPDSILNKPGPLNPEEWELMKNHSLEGYDILKDTDNPIINMAALIARDHHERWDGSGYPHGKKGKEITLEGRIVALADVFDALLSDRCYKKAWTLEETLLFIENESGSQFDPEIKEIFLVNKERFIEICQKIPLH